MAPPPPFTLPSDNSKWYGVFGSTPVVLVLVKDPSSPRAYDVALISTDLSATTEQIVERYASRWFIEVAFGDAKHVTGAGQARNRTPTAVRRTVPFHFLYQSILTVWYATALNSDTIVNDVISRSPWYYTKAAPSTADMLAVAKSNHHHSPI